MTPTERDVLGVLTAAADHALCEGRPATRWMQAELAVLCDASIREVQAAIQALRLDGYPILSDSASVNPGVWLALRSEDVLANAKRLRSRAIHQLLTARALRRTGRRMEVQEATAARLTLWSA